MNSTYDKRKLPDLAALCEYTATLLKCPTGRHMENEASRAGETDNAPFSWGQKTQPRIKDAERAS